MSGATNSGSLLSSPRFSQPARPVVIDYELPLTKTRNAKDDSILFKRLSDSDPEALRELYAIYSKPVFGYLVRFLGDRTASEDVQQQVFLEVWEKADRFDPERGGVLNWLMTIARSRAIDHIRKRVPEPRDPGSNASLIEPEPPGRDGIDDVVETWHFAQIVGRLPDDEAELLKYRFQGELSQTEIAKQTGIPLGTVKSRMVSGLERLRQMMEAEA